MVWGYVNGNLLSKRNRRKTTDENGNQVEIAGCAIWEIRANNKERVKSTKEKIEFTEEEKIVLLEVAEKVFFNLQWDSQFSRWVEDSSEFMIEFEDCDHKLLSNIIEKLKGI